MKRISIKESIIGALKANVINRVHWSNGKKILGIERVVSDMARFLKTFWLTSIKAWYKCWCFNIHITFLSRSCDFNNQMIKIKIEWFDCLDVCVIRIAFVKVIMFKRLRQWPTALSCNRQKCPTILVMTGVVFVVWKIKILIFKLFHNNRTQNKSKIIPK